MYICICNALSDRQLSAAATGARSVAEVFRCCGSRPQCGKCLPDVARLIEAQSESANDQRHCAIAAE